MLIELLYVPGCPNHEPALDKLREGMRSECVDVTVREIAVTNETMARSLSFPGSPTIRIDGRDIEPSDESAVGLACRLYSNGTGVPSSEILKRAISGAKKSERQT